MTLCGRRGNHEIVWRVMDRIDEALSKGDPSFKHMILQGVVLEENRATGEWRLEVRVEPDRFARVTIDGVMMRYAHSVVELLVAQYEKLYDHAVEALLDPRGWRAAGELMSG